MLKMGDAAKGHVYKNLLDMRVSGSLLSVNPQIHKNILST